MSNPSKIAVKEADGPNGSPYLSNMIVSGKTVYLAGCIGIGENNALVPGGVAPETTQALKEAAKRLAFIGLHLSDVVSVTIYISNYAENFSGLQKAYLAAFPTDSPLPVRCGIGVAALPLNAAVEFSIIAATRD
ncbi:uncharacterized protein EHS24_001556 [Apiotrichum porosum]|uniref:Uncharacterized protein n=1 Tax=Apiotrichum porosum TaxID=105984 RepID=A0A427XL76_9TREE|nr:uncharacterized protein EHS24_001556 [Apiotrichum porosum]RSH79504.1 hypothetical protein EHS24_001556 [Apiotrichum porosum]